VDSLSVAACRLLAATPPLASLAGATVAALNTYKKNFLKNIELVDIKRKNRSQSNLQQLNTKTL